MNGSLKYNSTEIIFTGDIDECLARCKKTSKLLNIIRIFSLLGILGGGLLSGVMFGLGVVIGIICGFVFYKSIGVSFICTFDLLEKVKKNKIKGIEFKKVSK